MKYDGRNRTEANTDALVQQLISSLSIGQKISSLVFSDN